MYLLTEWEGRAGKYLAWGQSIGTERSEVPTSWPRAKYFPVRPDLIQSIKHFIIWPLAVENFENFCLNLNRTRLYKIRRPRARCKMKKNSTEPDCPYCHGIDQNATHLFVECSNAKSFWNKFYKVVQRNMWGNIVLEQNDIIYGVLRYPSSCLTLNHLIIIGKYFFTLKEYMMKKRHQFHRFCNPC